MLKSVATNVLSVSQGAAVDYAAVQGITSPCCFGITTGQYGETQFIGAGNIIQEFGGQKYLMFTTVGSNGVPQYRRLLLQPWTPPPL